MIIPDVIVSWPRNCDYPLWRQFIRDNRFRFNEIIIAFTETNQGPDFRDFIRKSMFSDHVHFIEPRALTSGEDWRNVAINRSLLHSYNAEWIWFTEQDFIVQNAMFWDDISKNQDRYNIMGVFQGDRLHPCCILAKRTLLNETKKDFGIGPDYDHFGRFQRDIVALESPIYKIEYNYTHLNGLSHNMTLVERGEAPNYQADQFKKWLVECMKVRVPIDPRFTAIANAIL